MKQATAWAMGVVAVAVAAAGGGYWLGTRGGASAAHGEATVTAGAAGSEKKTAKLLYYRNPMGLPDTSPTPKKDPMGMDYIAVYEGEQDDEPASANQIKISTEKIQKLGVRTEAATLRQAGIGPQYIKAGWSKTIRTGQMIGVSTRSLQIGAGTQPETEDLCGFFKTTCIGNG